MFFSCLIPFAFKFEKQYCIKKILFEIDSMQMFIPVSNLAALSHDEAQSKQHSLKEFYKEFIYHYCMSEEIFDDDACMYML